MKRRERLAYSVLTVAGLTSVTAGIGLVFLPAALVVGGLAAASLGLIGLRLVQR